MMRAHVHCMLTLALFTGAAPLHAQSGKGIVDWISPGGGVFDDPANWSTQTVPTSQDTARFDLDAVYDVLGPSNISVADLMIGDSDVRWTQIEPRKGASSLFTLGLLIGTGQFDTPRRLSAPGRLTLDGRLGVDTSYIALGSGNLASQLVIGPDARVRSYGLYGTQSSSIAFVLGGNPDDSWWPRLILVPTKGGGFDYGGSLVVDAEPTGSGDAPLAVRHSLIASYDGVSVSMFDFILTRPRAGESFDFSVDQGEFGPELVATVEPAPSVVNIVPSESSALGTPPRRILAADLDGDGLDELVVCLGARLVNVYRNLGSGDFGVATAYELVGDPVDVSAADYDGDGTIDLAFGCTAPDALSFLLNPGNDPENLATGPSTAIATEVRSISTASFIAGQSLASERGVALTSATVSGSGRIGSYQIDGAAVIKIAEVEVGDDPGPSDPIDDENKKDPDPPIGVGMNAAAAGSRGVAAVPIFRALASTPNGLSPINSVPLTGRAVDFVSGYFDWDGIIDCFVITDTGNLDLIRPLGGDSVWSVPLGGTPTSIAAANLQGDLFPEIVIGLADPPRIEVFAIRPQSGPPGFDAGFEQVVLERISVSPLSSAPLAVAATGVNPDGAAGGSVVIGLDGGGPSINIGDVDVIPTPECVRADFNRDGIVDGDDISQILAAWGACPGCEADLDGNGVVDGDDLGLLYTLWGDCTN